jgi:hypothetical protein
MKMKRFHSGLHSKSLLVLFLAASCVVMIAPASAQNPGTRDNVMQQDRDNAPPSDNDTTRGELANFDRFLDRHPELSDQLRKDPSLIDNRDFVENHPALAQYLQDHPKVREEIKENPNAFMRKENHYERNENENRRDDHDRDRDRGDHDTTRRQLGLFDQFLDSHPEIAEQLRKDPSLVDNREFEKNHPALQEYLQKHPGVREEIKENPNAFMHQENRYERTEERFDKDRDNDRDDRGDRGRDHDTTRRELANFDHFMDSHPEIAEQLRKNPSLVDNREFVQQHPALHDYLQDHPAVREEIKENPNAFMKQEQHYERTENRQGEMHGDHDRDRHGDSGSFQEFLGAHSSISEQVSKDPSLLKNQEYLASHPELQEYLKTHPDAQAQFQANPESFKQPAKTAPVKTPTPDPTKKQ